MKMKRNQYEEWNEWNPKPQRDPNQQWNTGTELQHKESGWLGTVCQYRAGVYLMFHAVEQGAGNLNMKYTLCAAYELREPED